MLNTIPSSQQLNSLKPIKEIKLRMFKQIYQKQKSKSNLFDQKNYYEPRKSFINVTRRHSTADCLNYASVGNLQPSKNFIQCNKLSTNDVLSNSEQKRANSLKGKQNNIINRIPIKIRSKRVNPNKLKLKQEKKQHTSRRTKKLLLSPFHDDFICIERQSIIEEYNEQIH